MTTLENLYYGNIRPSERHINGAENAHLLEHVCKHEDALTETFSEQQKEIFDKYKDCRGELSGMAEREAFRAGIIPATRIMIEVMAGMDLLE